MERRVSQVNHISLADDTILFTSGRAKSLKLIMQTLKTDKDSSSQLIKSENSHFVVHNNVFDKKKRELKGSLGLNKGKGLPITWDVHALWVGPGLHNFLTFFLK